MTDSTAPGGPSGAGTPAPRAIPLPSHRMTEVAAELREAQEASYLQRERARDAARAGGPAAQRPATPAAAGPPPQAPGRAGTASPPGRGAPPPRPKRGPRYKSGTAAAPAGARTRAAAPAPRPEPGGLLLSPAEVAALDALLTTHPQTRHLFSKPLTQRKDRT